MKKSIIFVVLILTVFVFSLSLTSSVGRVLAAESVPVLTTKVFSVEELAKYNGKDGSKAYTSYKGSVYDVTDSTLWKLGEHFGLMAGIDLTDKMKEAPHGEEVFKGFKIIGTLEGYDDPANVVVKEEAVEIAKDSIVDNDDEVQEVSKGAWYEKRIKIGSFSILGWTGIILAVFFVFTFASCFALPWAKLPLPWKGSKIGPDLLDGAGKHLTWSSVHKHFVWVTVVIGIIHGIIGFLQMMGIYL